MIAILMHYSTGNSELLQSQCIVFKQHCEKLYNLFLHSIVKLASYSSPSVSVFAYSKLGTQVSSDSSARNKWLIPNWCLLLYTNSELLQSVQFKQHCMCKYQNSIYIGVLLMVKNGTQLIQCLLHRIIQLQMPLWVNNTVFGYCKLDIWIRFFCTISYWLITMVITLYQQSCFKKVYTP